MAKLYLVPTPIGNLEDMTFRAIKTLNSVDLILAEDTRTSAKLMHHYQIKTPMQSYHMHNEHGQLQKYIELLLDDKCIALISDAGTPAISDPGFLLTRACIENKIPIECLPGATAFVPALVMSGFPNEKFVFEGFLPDKKGRQTRFLHLKEETRTMIFYVSPHKIIKTLKDFGEYFGEDRLISVSREISKLHEETVRGKCIDVLKKFEIKPPKGEIVVVVNRKETD
jgi:16S rRNA (cytidine1402-2'-O)-methyltransferase